jgi:hypothetical protein
MNSASGIAAVKAKPIDFGAALGVQIISAFGL